MKVSSIMLGGSKKKPKSPSRKTSRNEEKERKGRCRLDFSSSSEKKPLEGMKIFLDIPSQKAAQMSAQIIQLGGKVEDFVSKDISLIVTTKGIDSRGDGAAQSPSPLSTASPNNPLSNKSKSVGLSPFSNDSPHYSVESGKKRLPSANAFSRAGKMLSMVSSTSVKKSCSTGRDVVAQAKRFGAKALSLEDFREQYLGKHALKEVDLAALKSKRTTSTDTVRSSRLTSVAQIQVTKLGEPFVKIESKSRKYRPIYYEINKWPKLYLEESNTLRDCPFDVPDVNQSTKKLQNAAELDEGCPSVAERSDEGGSVKEVKRGREDKPEGKGRPNERNGAGARKISYCDCCCVRYADLKKHIRSEKHRKFARNMDNYKDLDRLLALGTSFHEFLNVLENNTRRRESSRSDQDSSLTSPTTPRSKNQKKKKVDAVRCIAYENVNTSPEGGENKENENQLNRRKDANAAATVDERDEKEIPYVSQKDEKEVLHVGAENINDIDNATLDVTNKMLDVSQKDEMEKRNVAEKNELEIKGLSEKEQDKEMSDEEEDTLIVGVKDEKDPEIKHLGKTDEKAVSNVDEVNQIDEIVKDKEETQTAPENGCLEVLRIKEEVDNKFEKVDGDTRNELGVYHSDQTLADCITDCINELIDKYHDDKIGKSPPENEGIPTAQREGERKEQAAEEGSEEVLIERKNSVKSVTFADEILLEQEETNVKKVSSPQSTEDDHMEVIEEVESQLDEIVNVVDESLSKIVNLVGSSSDDVFLDAETSTEKKLVVKGTNQPETRDENESKESIGGLLDDQKGTISSCDVKVREKDEETVLQNLDDGLEDVPTQQVDDNFDPIVDKSPTKSLAQTPPKSLSLPQPSPIESLVSPPSPQQPPSPSLWSGGSRSSQGSPSSRGKPKRDRKKSKSRGGISRILLLSPQPNKSDMKTHLEKSADENNSPVQHQPVTEHKPLSIEAEVVLSGNVSGGAESSVRNRCGSGSAPRGDDQRKAEVRNSPRLRKQKKDNGEGDKDDSAIKDNRTICEDVKNHSSRGGVVPIAYNENALGAKAEGRKETADSTISATPCDLSKAGKEKKKSGKKLERKAYEMRRLSSENDFSASERGEHEVSTEAKTKVSKKKKKMLVGAEQKSSARDGKIESPVDMIVSPENVTELSTDMEKRVEQACIEVKIGIEQSKQSLTQSIMAETVAIALRQSPRSLKQKAGNDGDETSSQKQLVKEVVKKDTRKKSKQAKKEILPRPVQEVSNEKSPKKSAVNVTEDSSQKQKSLKEEAVSDKKTAKEAQKLSRTKKPISGVRVSPRKKPAKALSTEQEMEATLNIPVQKLGIETNATLRQSPRSLKKQSTVAVDVQDVLCSSPKKTSETKAKGVVEESPITARVEQIKHSVQVESSVCDTSTEPYAMSMLGHTVSDSAGEISQISAKGKVSTTSASSADGEVSSTDTGHPPQVDWSQTEELTCRKKGKDDTVAPGQTNQSQVDNICKPPVDVVLQGTKRDQLGPPLTESSFCDISTEPYAMYSMSENEIIPVVLGANDDTKDNDHLVLDSGDKLTADEPCADKMDKADKVQEVGSTAYADRVEDELIGAESKHCTLEVRTLCVISSIKDESFNTQAYEDIVKIEVKKETEKECAEMENGAKESWSNAMEKDNLNAPLMVENSPSRGRPEPADDMRDKAVKDEILSEPGLVSSTPCKSHSEATLKKETALDSSSKNQDIKGGKVELDFSLHSSFDAQESPGHRPPSLSQDLFDKITAIACKENLSPICRKAKRGKSERKRALSRTLDKTLERDVGQDEEDSDKELRKILCDADEENVVRGDDIFESPVTQKLRAPRACVKTINARCQSETTSTRPRRQAFTKASESLASEMFSKLDETPEKSFDSGSDGAWLFDPVVQQIINFRSPGGGASSRKRRVAADQIVGSPSLQDLGLADLVEKISEDARKGKKKKKKKKKKRLEFGDDEIFPRGTEDGVDQEKKGAADAKADGTVEQESHCIPRSLSKRIPKPVVPCDGSDIELLRSECSDQLSDSDDKELSKLSRVDLSSNRSVLQVNDIFTPESRKNMDAKCSSDVESPRRKSRKTSCNEKLSRELNDSLDDEVFALKHEDSEDDDEGSDVSLVTLIKVKRRSCQSKRKVVSPTELSRERKKSRNNNNNESDLTNSRKARNHSRASDNTRGREDKTDDTVRATPTSRNELRTNNTPAAKDSIAFRLSFQSTPAKCSSSKQKRSYSERTRQETVDSANSDCVRTGSVDCHKNSRTAPLRECGKVSEPSKASTDDGMEKKKYGELRTKPPRGLTSPISTNFDSDDSPSSGIFFASPSRSSKRILSAKETSDRSKSLNTKKDNESTQRLKSFPPHTDSTTPSCASPVPVQLSPVEETSVSSNPTKSKRSKLPKSTSKPKGKTKAVPGENAIAFSKAAFKKGTHSVKSSGNTCQSDSPIFSSYEFTGS